MHRRLAALSPYLLALLPWVWVLWPLLVGDRFYVSEDGSTLLGTYPVYHAMGSSLRDGRLPLWTPLIANGYPMMAEGEAGVIYPLNLFLFKYLPPYEAHRLALAVAPLLSLLGAYYYLRHRRHSLFAALLGGMCFAFGGYFLGHLWHLAHLQAMSMLPVALLFTERFLERRKLFDAIMAGSAWAVTWLAGMPQVGWLTGFAMGLAVVLRAGEKPDPALFIGTSMKGLERLGPRLLKAALFLPGVALLTGLLAAPQLMMTWELIPMSTRAGGLSLEASARDSVGWAELVHVVAPHLHGIPAAGTYTLSSRYAETLGYVGLVPLLLAMLSLRLLRRDRRVVFPLVLVLVSGLLALGTNTPIFALAWKILPGLAWFSAPGRFLLLVCLGLGALAALGLDLLLERLEYHPGAAVQRVAAALPWVALGLTGIDLGYHGAALMAWTAKAAVVDEPATKRAMPGLGAYRILSLPGGSVREGGDGRPPVDLRSDRAPFLEARALLQHNYNMVHDVNAVGATIGLPFSAHERLMKRLMEGIEPDGKGGLRVSDAAFNLMNFFGVRLVQTFLPIEDERLVRIEDVPIPGLTTPVKRYGIEEPHPRAYVARKLKPCGPEVTFERVVSGRFGYGWEPCREGTGREGAEPEESVGVAGYVKMKSRGDSYIEFEVNMLNPGYLVVRETHTPGWIAILDKLEVEIVPVDLIYKAVAVPQGNHVVRLEYRPDGMSTGLGLNLLGLILVVFGVLVARSPRQIEQIDGEAPAHGEERWYR